MRAGPVLYDLRRSVLRVSTLVLLALAIVAGAGMTYLLRVSILQGGVALEDVNFMGALAVTEGRAYLVGVSFDSYGRPLEGIRVELLVMGRVVAEAVSSGEGLVVVEVSVRKLLEEAAAAPGAPVAVQPAALPVPALRLTRGSVNLTASATPEGWELPGPRGVVSFKRVSAHVLDLGVRPEAYRRSLGEAPLVYLDSTVLKTGDGRVVAVVFGFSLDGGSPRAVGQPLCYNVSRVAISAGLVAMAGGLLLEVYDPPQVPANATMACRGSLESFWGRLDLGVPEELAVGAGARLLIIGVGSPGEYEYYSGTVFTRSSRALRAVALSLSGSISVVLQVFAIAAVYLSNQLMARPRSSGELEFVLSGPVTRVDLFVCRYAAQLMAFAAMTAVFALALQVFCGALLGVSLDAESLAYVFAAAFLTMAAFLSLSYSMASSLRSGLYMAVAVAAYVVFMLFWDALMYVVGFSLGARGYQEISEFASRSVYFNPRVAGAFFAERLQTSVLGTQGVLDPLLAALSIAAWIAVPPLIAYLRFRRIPLYST